MSRAEVKRRLPRGPRDHRSRRGRGRPIGTLSHGFRQRVGVAQAIIHQPKFLILDEPTRGLDPVQIVEMRNLIHDLKQNHTVLISSHILTEISQTCDRLLVLGEASCSARAASSELVANESEIRQITVTVRAPSRATVSRRRGDRGQGQGGRRRSRRRSRRSVAGQASAVESVRAGRRPHVLAVDRPRTVAPKSAARSSRPSSI